MEFTTKELAVLNQMISIALLSGQIEFSEEARSGSSENIERDSTARSKKVISVTGNQLVIIVTEKAVR